jgi:glutathione synthase/RimK-type ligase-like ATP-grasp enzyme
MNQVDLLKKNNIIKKIRKTFTYAWIRRYFPMSEPHYTDDRDKLDEAEIITIDWPVSMRKPFFGILKDYGNHPKWTKYCRFLDNNSFNYEFYDIHTHDWLEKAKKYDIIVGISSSATYDLQELRSKFYILETFLGKKCFPSLSYALLYEDKCLEAYISQVYQFPFAKTYISHQEKDAIELLKIINYPIVFKIVPSSGSYGVELVGSRKRGEQIIRDVFSRTGKNTYMLHYKQKNMVYFQEFIQNDGYDIRVIVTGNWVFGYYRKILPGDFRASGMNLIEWGELPDESMKIALSVNKILKSPLLAVDMLHGLDGRYYIIEYSPFYLADSPDELRLNGVPGVYIFDEDGTYHFHRGRYWVGELALREFLINDYLPMHSTRDN